MDSLKARARQIVHTSNDQRVAYEEKFVKGKDGKHDFGSWPRYSAPLPTVAMIGGSLPILVKVASTEDMVMKTEMSVSWCVQAPDEIHGV